jgi:hypothetical protein
MCDRPSREDDRLGPAFLPRQMGLKMMCQQASCFHPEGCDGSSLVMFFGAELRHGGLVASLPWIAAIVATPLGGILSDRLSMRFGRVQSARILIMTGYTLSEILLLVAAQAHSRLCAVPALCTSLGSLYLAESSFWTTATAIAGNRAGRHTGRSLRRGESGAGQITRESNFSRNHSQRLEGDELRDMIQRRAGDFMGLVHPTR